MPEPTRIKIEYAFKVNLGNFENVEVRVGVEDNVRQNETVSEAYDRIDKFVSAKVKHEVAEAKAEAR